MHSVHHIIFPHLKTSTLDHIRWYFPLKSLWIHRECMITIKSRLNCSKGDIQMSDFNVKFIILHLSIIAPADRWCVGKRDVLHFRNFPPLPVHVIGWLLWTTIRNQHQHQVMYRYVHFPFTKVHFICTIATLRHLTVVFPIKTLRKPQNYARSFGNNALEYSLIAVPGYISKKKENFDYSSIRVTWKSVEKRVCKVPCKG